MLSSGTSGEPQPIVLTAANHEASAAPPPSGSGSTPTTAGSAAWLNHVGGLSILIRSVLYGTAAVVEEAFDVERVAALIERR